MELPIIYWSHINECEMTMHIIGDQSPTVTIETHGCKLNQADSTALASEFLGAGFRLVTENEQADVYVVNSCTVTHVADRKARHAIRAARRRNPDGMLVATGCYAERAPGSLRALAEVDLVAGNVEKTGLVHRILEWRGNHSIVPCAEGKDVSLADQSVSRNRAMVKIQEGCNQVCAYCIVPRVRGRERSLSSVEIVDTINSHVSNGYKEVVLTGTQLGSYGFDLPDIDLVGLLEQVLSETSVPRLRVSSLQPQEIDARLLGLWSDRRLCPHFHIPLQSGSDDVLRRMRRRYDAEQYINAVKRIRETVSGVSVTTDVIMGFPGETDDDFEQTYNLCDKISFADMHVFPYSIRPGTSAAHFQDQVDASTKSERVRRMIAMSNRKSDVFRDQEIGSTRRVLWEGPKDGMDSGWWVGLTDNYVRVIGRSREALSNVITDVRLLRRQENLIVGQVL